VVRELVLLCEVRELLALGLYFIGDHLLDELILDVPIDEVVVFKRCLPFLHVVIVHSRLEGAKCSAYNKQCMPPTQVFIELVRWILKIFLDVSPHFVLEFLWDFLPF
jgi:hypothetical protein